MKKFLLSKEHLEKRAQKKKLQIRLDTFGTPLQFELAPSDYFDYTFSFPDDVERVLLDCMYEGDWFAMYESELRPTRRAPWLARFQAQGIDLFGEYIKIVKSRNMECFLTDRVSESYKDKSLPTKYNYPKIKDEHPEWFIPAWGQSTSNFTVPEIREHKVKILGEVMRKYPFDGLDIDFERHTPILPVGKQWELRENVTEYMRMLRAEMLKISKEQGRVILLSARVPDCLKGCHEDGLDIEQWIKEELVDCLTLGSRSFDVKIEEFKALSSEIQLYPCYETFHTVDGYTFPTIETIRGVCYNWFQRGADGIEVFNWICEDKEKTLDLVHRYGLPERYAFMQYSNDDTHRLGDLDFLESQDKTYVIDRKGGYPWGIGYGNLNADRQLPLAIEKAGEVRLFVGENTAKQGKATLKLLIAETAELPDVYFNGKKLAYEAKSFLDPQVTKAEKAPISGAFPLTSRVYGNPDYKAEEACKRCIMLTADVTGMETKIGYNGVCVVAKTPTSLEKVELEVKR